MVCLLSLAQIALVIVGNMSIWGLGFHSESNKVKGTLMVIKLFTMYLRSFANESKTYKPMEAII
jgi:hypothetical protein